jgi:hypothetical protein
VRLSTEDDEDDDDDEDSLDNPTAPPKPVAIVGNTPKHGGQIKPPV